MMTNTKWLRRALLGGVALSVMAAGAHADELKDLKSELEALQSRVNQLEQEPRAPALPEGTSLLTMSRGMTQMPNYGTKSARHDDYPEGRGFTIAVTPTADLPAPVAEVVVYGFVKGDVIVDFDKDLGDTFNVPTLWSSSGADEDTHVKLHARQSRFGIDSRVDTAIGQIRTKIEGDFFSAGNAFRLRHAYGEWDMTPTWTLLVGQTWRTGVLLPIGIPTVDFSGPAGHGFPRAAQVRLTYHAGPISWAVAAEAPSDVSAADWPDLAAYVTYDIPGGHSLIVTGALTDSGAISVLDPFDTRPPASRSVIYSRDSEIGWMISAGANVNLADIATLTGGFVYAENGAECTYLGQAGAFCGGPTDIDKNPAAGTRVARVDPTSPFFGLFGQTIPRYDFFTDRGWGFDAGISFNINETTSLNAAYGFIRLENDFRTRVADHVDVHTVHGNILWQPVQQMRLGWEVMWGRYDIDTGPAFSRTADSSDDAIRGQFGAWFFF